MAISTADTLSHLVPALNRTNYHLLSGFSYVGMNVSIILARNDSWIFLDLLAFLLFRTNWGLLDMHMQSMLLWYTLTTITAIAFSILGISHWLLVYCLLSSIEMLGTIFAAMAIASFGIPQTWDWDVTFSCPLSHHNFCMMLPPFFAIANHH